ncbi:putative F-box protein At3g10240 [Quercus suber]|uniref:putative F-box protein At3g10240 n=1 Tax=Quercus suber TaxID=58331 RepID=UPI0032DE874E
MSDYLPEEVVLEILQRLPVKSLIRFRCVSKSWNSLITTPAFINSHLTRSHSLSSDSNKLIVRHCLDKPYVEHYKLIDDSNDSFDQIQNIELPISSRRIQHFRLIGSANGLFSLYEKERFILWNPSIRKFITLPKPCITVKAHGHLACRSAFGFDPRTNDFKVVRIAFPSVEAKPPLIEAYSLNEDSWKLTTASFPPGIDFSDWHRPAASLFGAVHFAVYDKDNRSRPLVLSFDLGDEVFRLMSLPNCAFSWSNIQTSVDFRQRDMPATRGKTPARRGSTTCECIRATTGHNTSTTDNNTSTGGNTIASTRGNTTQRESTPATRGIAI